MKLSKSRVIDSSRWRTLFIGDADEADGCVTRTGIRLPRPSHKWLRFAAKKSGICAGSMPVHNPVG